MFWSKARKIEKLEHRLYRAEQELNFYTQRYKAYLELYNDAMNEIDRIKKANEETKPVRDSKGRFISKSITSAEVPLV